LRRPLLSIVRVLLKLNVRANTREPPPASTKPILGRVTGDFT
jgi:hypothetical protein